MDEHTRQKARLMGLRAAPVAIVYDPALLAHTPRSLLAATAVRGLDHAINTACASHPHPLALYVFEDDRAILDRIQRATTAGGVTVNDTILHIAQHSLPFGGAGPSGIGAYHGEAGFRTFSRMKPVMRQARFNFVSLLNPPYGATFRAMLKLLLGR